MPEHMRIDTDTHTHTYEQTHINLSTTLFQDTVSRKEQVMDIAEIIIASFGLPLGGLRK